MSNWQKDPVEYWFNWAEDTLYLYTDGNGGLELIKIKAIKKVLKTEMEINLWGALICKM